MGKADKIAVVDDGDKVIAGLRLLIIFKQGENLDLAEDGFLVASLILFKHHPNF
jgi:hypothetical protein